MRRTLAVAYGVGWRVLNNVVRNPALLVPSLVFPLFFFTAFAGGLSRVNDVFEFPAGYTAFQFVFVLLQSAAFSGVFTGFGIARDFEHGFARRLLIAAPHRSGIVLGYALAALFLSSMALPRDLIETDWFRTVADWNPVSYMLEGIRSLVITGWDAEALALGFACAGGVAVIGLAAASSALRTRMVRT